MLMKLIVKHVKGLPSLQETRSRDVPHAMCKVQRVAAVRRIHLAILYGAKGVFLHEYSGRVRDKRGHITKCSTRNAGQHRPSEIASVQRGRLEDNYYQADAGSQGHVDGPHRKKKVIPAFGATAAVRVKRCQLVARQVQQVTIMRTGY